MAHEHCANAISVAESDNSIGTVNLFATSGTRDASLPPANSSMEVGSIASRASVNPQDIIGKWGNRLTNSYEYEQRGIAPVRIQTDDGLWRTAYPYSLARGMRIDHLPQEEWETPTGIGSIQEYFPDGTFRYIAQVEAGTMPQGYGLMQFYGQGTYTVEGDIVTMYFDYSHITNYNDLNNHFNTETYGASVKYFRFLPRHEIFGTPGFVEVVRQADGSFVPTPQNPDGFGVERYPLGEPIRREVGVSFEGTLRDDQLTGTINNDRILGQGGNDTLDGGNGHDFINGNSGNDQIVGGLGNDTLHGKGGRDVLSGGYGDDMLNGGGGHDVLAGDRGNDVIFTGAGRDRIVIRPGHGLDQVRDFTDRLDRIVLGGGLRFNQLTIQQRQNDVLISRGGEQLLLLQNVNVNQINQADFMSF